MNLLSSSCSPEAKGWSGIQESCPICSTTSVWSLCSTAHRVLSGNLFCLPEWLFYPFSLSSIFSFHISYITSKLTNNLPHGSWVLEAKASSSPPGIIPSSWILRAFLVTQSVKNLPAVQETWVQSLGWEDALEEQMATHSSILAWKISCIEEPGGLQSMGSQSRARLSY